MKTNQLKAGAILSYISMLLGFIISIIYTPIMLRLLGQSEYGLYNLVSSVVAYLGILNFGFGSAYIRFYSQYKAHDDKSKVATLNGMFLIVFLLIGIITIIAGIILILNTTVFFGNKLSVYELSKAKILMVILVFNLAISFPNIVFTSYITVNECFVFYQLVQVLKIVVSPFIILPLLLMGYSSIGMVVATTLINICIEIINAIYCLRKLNMKFSFRNFDFRLMKEMTVFSSFIFINSIADQINWNIDKFILGRYYGTISVAIYGLAAQLNTYYLAISTVVSKFFIPRVHRLISNSNRDEEILDLFTKIGRVQFLILSMVLIFVVFFGKPFIQLWAGNDYTGSYSILLLLMFPVSVPLIQTIGIEIQRAKNMHKFRSWVYLVIAICNLAITIPLVKNYGGIGAAIGTAISVTIGHGFIINWYNHVKVGINMKYFWNQILCIIPALIIPALIGFIISSYFDLYNIVNFIVFGFIYFIIFAISAWFIGMNKFEKNLIIKLIKKLNFNFR